MIFDDAARQRLIERGAEILREQGGAVKSERDMRLQLAAEFGIDERDLVCVAEAAGALYRERRAIKAAAA